MPETILGAEQFGPLRRRLDWACRSQRVRRLGSVHKLRTSLPTNFVGTGGDFVPRLTTRTNFTVVPDRKRSDKDNAAGVISDRTGYRTGCRHSMPPGHLLREVIVADDADADDAAKPPRLLTRLPKRDAHPIGAPYLLRWQACLGTVRRIDVFFRVFKPSAHYTRLIGHNKSRRGVGACVAFIGVTLMAITRGNRRGVYDPSCC